MSIPEWFKAMGIPRSCVKKCSSCEEKGRSFSIAPEPSDEIWRVKVDGCWLDGERKKVDYLFWVKSKSSKRAILLVELKGEDYGKALRQIESTLRHLCKRSAENILHTGSHQDSPGHDPVKSQGVQAYVILSHGRKIPQYHAQSENLRQRYQVRVKSKAQRLHIEGVERLFNA